MFENIHKSSNSVIPVILCGGSGTRLWPLSRESFPKQFLSLDYESENSLLQNTFKRLEYLDRISNPILVCNERHRFIVAEQMREIGVSPKAILLEPFGRNTAPAIAIAALKAIETDNDPTLLIVSSDHIIRSNENFIRSLRESIDLANDNKLVACGIVPTSPETGYGYIEVEDKLDIKNIRGSKIKKFVEKPSFKTATQFLKSEKYVWNSGIFIFKASVIIKELERFSPEIIKLCREAIRHQSLDLDFHRIEKKYFNSCPSISIDVAVMEKTELGMVVPLDAGWSDIGNWKSLWDNQNKDNDGNLIEGNVIAKSCKNSLLMSKNRHIVGIGLTDIIVVETNDAILISNMAKSQEVKNIVCEMKDKGISAATIHRKIYRPWGFYVSVVEGHRWQVKRIEVNPGASLSLQMHHHRAEHWVIVTGTARVFLDDKESLLTENQSIFIPVGSKHKLCNPGKLPLVLIEVQSGCYLEEDDIFRFEDDYGRG